LLPSFILSGNITSFVVISPEAVVTLFMWHLTVKEISNQNTRGLDKTTRHSSISNTPWIGVENLITS